MVSKQRRGKPLSRSGGRFDSSLGRGQQLESKGSGLQLAKKDLVQAGGVKSLKLRRLHWGTLARCGRCRRWIRRLLVRRQVCQNRVTESDCFFPLGDQISIPSRLPHARNSRRRTTTEDGPELQSARLKNVMAGGCTYPQKLLGESGMVVPLHKAWRGP